MPVLSCIKLSDDERRALLDFVWQVLEQALAGQGFQLPNAPRSETLRQPAASFVTLHHNGQLRGCIGSLSADEALWKNVCHNAYASGFKDARFAPLTAQDKAGLSVEISVLSALTPVENQGEAELLQRLRPDIDGLLLEDERHRAVFLPSVWQALPEPDQFVAALKAKGGWPPGYWSKDIDIHLFSTTVISDNAGSV
ncbi:AmmeMemoRadiSam system protein A [Vibrio sp. CDRSL-10 TSBA]